MTDSRQNLAEYLSDHLAGATAAVELLERLSQPENGGRRTPTFAQLLAAIEKDRVVLAGIHDRIGAEPGVVKSAVAWLAEKSARAKLTLAPDRPMGTFLAVEMLALGVQGKRSLWDALELVAGEWDALRGTDFDGLRQRAVTQHAQLERVRLELAAEALALRSSGVRRTS